MTDKMPCGYDRGKERIGKLKASLQHYRVCNHPACKARLDAWEEMKKKWKKEVE